MSGDDGWIAIVGIGHILSLTVAVRYVREMNDSIQNDDAMMDSNTLAYRHLIVEHGGVRCQLSDISYQFII